MFLWQATDNLTINAGYANVSAEIDEFNCPVGAANCSTRSGLDVPFSPDTKYSIGVDYVQELSNMDILYNASYVYTDDQVANLPSNSGTFAPAWFLPDYALLNASVAFSFNDDAYRVTLIGKNLTDESFFTTYSGDNFRYQVPRDADRYFGVQFRASFLRAKLARCSERANIIFEFVSVCLGAYSAPFLLFRKRYFARKEFTYYI